MKYRAIVEIETDETQETVIADAEGGPEVSTRERLRGYIPAMLVDEALKRSQGKRSIIIKGAHATVEPLP